MQRKMIRRPKGGFLPAMLAGAVGRAALGYLVPKAMDYVSKKMKGKKRGKGIRLLGSKSKGCGLYRHGAGLYPHGGRGLYPHGGKGIVLHGQKGKGIKQIITKLKTNPMVQNLIKRGKEYVKSKVNQAIDDPIGTYKSVRKAVTGKGRKAMKTLSVKQRRMPKRQLTGVESSQVGRTTAITLSKTFPHTTRARTKTIKQIKKIV